MVTVLCICKNPFVVVCIGLCDSQSLNLNYECKPSHFSPKKKNKNKLVWFSSIIFLWHTDQKTNWKNDLRTWCPNFLDYRIFSIRTRAGLHELWYFALFIIKSRIQHYEPRKLCIYVSPVWSSFFTTMQFFCRNEL